MDKIFWSLFVKELTLLSALSHLCTFEQIRSIVEASNSHRLAVHMQWDRLKEYMKLWKIPKEVCLVCYIIVYTAAYAYEPAEGRLGYKWWMFPDGYLNSGWVRD